MNESKKSASDSSQTPQPSTLNPQPEIVSFPSDDFAAAVALETQERDFVFASDENGRPFDREILGVKIRPLTLGQALNLIHVGSPFLCTGLPTYEDVFRFLWYLSPAFDPKTDSRPWRLPIALRLLAKIPIIGRWALVRAGLAFVGRFLRPPSSRQWLLLQITALPLIAWWRAIRREYVDLIFADAPSADRDKDDSDNGQSDASAARTSDEIPLVSFACDYIDLFGSEYGWTAEYTLNQPLDRLFALMRSIEIRRYARWGKRAPLVNYRSDKVTAAHLEERNKPELKEERAKKFAHLFAHAPAES